MSFIAKHILEKCKHCNACLDLVACPGAEENICIGCGACTLLCPNEALTLVESKRKNKINIEVDGKKVFVPEKTSIKEALTGIGYLITDLPKKPEELCKFEIFAPCGVGACSSCSVEVDSVMKPACVTMIREGMKIITTPPSNYIPKRIVCGFTGHPSGGVGTPWHLRKDPKKAIEIVCYTAGCNFQCPQCQNWHVAFSGRNDFLTPNEAAKKMLLTNEKYPDVSRLTVSGGESTLNRIWLIKFLQKLKSLCKNKTIRLHVDTNGSLLTENYIDELVNAGMTDIGIDLKALSTDTFMFITGLKDEEKAEKYKKIAWNAVKYLSKHYKEKVFTGIGIPYNKDLISIEEVKDMGKKLFKIDPCLQVAVNDYQPAFRRKIKKTTSNDMKEVYTILKEIGLETVVCQSPDGFMCP